MFKGIGVSQGYGIGKTIVLEDAVTDYSNAKYTTAENEKKRLQNAVDSFIDETKRLAQALKD